MQHFISIDPGTKNFAYIDVTVDTATGTWTWNHVGFARTPSTQRYAIFAFFKNVLAGMQAAMKQCDFLIVENQMAGGSLLVEAMIHAVSPVPCYSMHPNTMRSALGIFASGKQDIIDLTTHIMPRGKFFSLGGERFDSQHVRDAVMNAVAFLEVPTTKREYLKTVPRL